MRRATGWAWWAPSLRTCCCNSSASAFFLGPFCRRCWERAGSAPAERHRRWPNRWARCGCRFLCPRCWRCCRVTCAGHVISIEGLLGRMVGDFLIHYLNLLGAYIVCASVIAVALYFSTAFSFGTAKAWAAAHCGF